MFKITGPEGGTPQICGGAIGNSRKYENIYHNGNDFIFGEITWIIIFSCKSKDTIVQAIVYLYQVPYVTCRYGMYNCM